MRDFGKASRDFGDVSEEGQTNDLRVYSGAYAGPGHDDTFVVASRVRVWGRREPFPE